MFLDISEVNVSDTNIEHIDGNLSVITDNLESTDPDNCLTVRKKPTSIHGTKLKIKLGKDLIVSQVHILVANDKLAG